MTQCFRSPDKTSWVWGDIEAMPGWEAVDFVSLGTLMSIERLCPDLLTLDQIGGADSWRGRVIRAFFSAMRLWPPRKAAP